MVEEAKGRGVLESEGMQRKEGQRENDIFIINKSKSTQTGVGCGGWH